MVLSSLIAAWSDISSALFLSPVTATALAAASKPDYTALVRKNAGYLWMLINCLASAAYVSSIFPSFSLSLSDWFLPVWVQTGFGYEKENQINQF